MHILGIMSFMYGTTQSAEAAGNIRLGQIKAADLITQVGQDLGYTTHAYPAYAYKEYMLTGLIHLLATYHLKTLFRNKRSGV